MQTDDKMEAAIAINKKARKRFLLWIFGFFGLFITVDIIFWVVASNSHTGVVVEQAYEKGLAYNDTISKAEAQATLGWLVDVAFDASKVTIMLKDKDAVALKGANIEVTFVRPTREGYDIQQNLSETKPGVYQAEVNLPLQGQWDLRVFITWNGQQYQMSKRVVQS